MISTLAALTWDPQIRGASIVVVAVAILCGSIYMILATNTGAKLGLLLALAGLTGWMFLMGIIWAVFGIGLKGEEPHWVVKEVIDGPAELATVDAVGEDFPRGWEKISGAAASDAQASADQVLAAGAVEAEPHGGGAEEAEHAAFEPVFDSPADYILVGAFEKGGEDYFLPGGGLEHDRGILHQPHYVVLQVKPVLEQESVGGAPPAPKPDPTAEVTTVVLERDLGNLRFPPTVFTISMAILFGITCNALHRRDKEIMALRAAPASA